MAFGTKKTVATLSFSKRMAGIKSMFRLHMRMQTIFMQRWRRRLRI